MKQHCVVGFVSNFMENTIPQGNNFENPPTFVTVVNAIRTTR